MSAMKVAVLGTGNVGRTIASKLVALGHSVCMGSRTSDNESAVAWAEQAGERGSQGTFEEAAAFGAWVFNCTSGKFSVKALMSAGADNLQGKIVVDVANPLDFSGGMPPSLTVCNDDSLGEQIQRAFPGARVVKALNTVNCSVMVDPGQLGQPTDIFVAGNDEEAKAAVLKLLKDGFGWERVVDLGGIEAARGMEMYLPLWVRLMNSLGTAEFNLRLVRARSGEE